MCTLIWTYVCVDIRLRKIVFFNKIQFFKVCERVEETTMSTLKGIHCYITFVYFLFLNISVWTLYWNMSPEMSPLASLFFLCFNPTCELLNAHGRIKPNVYEDPLLSILRVAVLALRQTNVLGSHHQRYAASSTSHQNMVS